MPYLVHISKQKLAKMNVSEAQYSKKKGFRLYRLAAALYLVPCALYVSTVSYVSLTIYIIVHS